MSRTITEIARILHDKVAWGLSTVDEKGNVIKQYSVDKNTRQITIPQADLIGNANSDNNSGSNNNNNNADDNNSDDNPNQTIDIDPGENICGVELLWQGKTAIDKATDINLSKSVRDAGDGLSFFIKISQLPITKGITGSRTELPVVSSKENKPVKGNYVCSCPIPISILTANFSIGKTLEIPLDGIGEGFETTKITTTPKLLLTQTNDTTINVKSVQGYALDENSADNNGAFYDAEIFEVRSWSKNKATQQLISGTELFNGSTDGGEIALTGVLDGFANIGSGISIYFSDYRMFAKQNNSDCTSGPVTNVFNITNPLKISKKDLIINSKIPLNLKDNLYYLWNDPPTRVLIGKASSDDPNVGGYLTVNRNSITFENTSNLRGTETTTGLPGADTSYKSSSHSLSVLKITSYTD